MSITIDILLYGISRCIVLQELYTQGNYATQDSSGMCHLMTQRHLPEWREEDERTFVHCGSSGVRHAIPNQVCHKTFQTVVRHFIVTFGKCS